MSCNLAGHMSQFPSFQPCPLSTHCQRPSSTTMGPLLTMNSGQPRGYRLRNLCRRRLILPTSKPSASFTTPRCRHFPRTCKTFRQILFAFPCSHIRRVKAGWTATKGQRGWRGPPLALDIINSPILNFLLDRESQFAPPELASQCPD